MKVFKYQTYGVNGIASDFAVAARHGYKSFIGYSVSNDGICNGAVDVLTLYTIMCKDIVIFPCPLSPAIVTPIVEEWLACAFRRPSQDDPEDVPGYEFVVCPADKTIQIRACYVPEENK